LAPFLKSSHRLASLARRFFVSKPVGAELGAFLASPTAFRSALGISRQAAADISKVANSTAFMIVRFASTATSLAAAGRQKWGDAAGLLDILRKVYGT
jgi:hypothetical protein